MTHGGDPEYRLVDLLPAPPWPLEDSLQERQLVLRRLWMQCGALRDHVLDDIEAQIRQGCVPERFPELRRALEVLDRLGPRCTGRTNPPECDVDCLAERDGCAGRLVSIPTLKFELDDSPSSERERWLRAGQAANPEPDMSCPAFGCS